MDHPDDVRRALLALLPTLALANTADAQDAAKMQPTRFRVAFDVAHQAQGQCHIVFVTAFDAFALAAFDVGAVDYRSSR